METVGAGEAKGDVLGKEKPEAVGAGAEAEGVKADDESETGKDLLDEKEVSRALLGIASLSNLPLPVQQRIRALRKNQLDIIELEKDYYKELHDLDTKYAKLYGNKFTLRRELVEGVREPTEQESEFPLGVGLALALSETSTTKDKAKDNNGTPPPPERGVSMFWCTIMRSIQPLADMVEEVDLPILRHLTDISYENTKEPLGFKLFFHFSPNDYFNNSVLTKSYKMKNEPDPEEPLTYDGPEIVSCEGCKIEWKEGKDVTLVPVEKRQKHKKTGTVRTVMKMVKQTSFFNFFSPPKYPEGEGEEVDEEEKDAIVDTLNLDFEVGQLLRERVIPRAVLYYTGEAAEDESESEYESGDSDSEEGEEEESEGEEDLEKSEGEAEKD